MEQLGPPSPDYEWARRLMTAEVNSAITAAFDAGATEVVVSDGHGSHTNLHADEIDQRASLITGAPSPLGMIEGIDSSFGAVIFVGFHARASTAGAVIDHTYTGTITDMTLNGEPVGEYGMSAAVAGYYGVPVVFISGDSAVSGPGSRIHSGHRDGNNKGRVHALHRTDDQSPSITYGDRGRSAEAARAAQRNPTGSYHNPGHARVSSPIRATPTTWP